MGVPLQPLTGNSCTISGAHEQGGSRREHASASK